MYHLTKKLTALAIFSALLFFPTTNILAGSLDSPAGPDDAGSAMYTLEDIYDRLNTNTQATKRAGGFTEPVAGPASTGPTLDEVYEKAIPTQVPKTGQTTCWDADGTLINCAGTGQDGDLQRGVAWPVPRFTDHGNGTVTDNLTGLMWVKAPHSLTDNTDTMTWDAAIDFCNGLTFADHSDWRLPNRRELFSLIDDSQSNPPLLPSGHPFTGVESSNYWSSTTFAADGAGFTTNAWELDVNRGGVSYSPKTAIRHVWPVRAGQ